MYFYFQQFLLDLIEVKYVVCYTKETQDVYELTEAGKNTLDLTLDILPGIIKLKVDTNLKYALDNVNEENSIVAEYTPVNENYYTVTCKIMENNECLFEVKTFAGSREQAKQIVKNWKKHAGTMYPNLLEILTQDFGDDDEDETEQSVHSVLGSPRDVYNYDVINRNTSDSDTSEEDDDDEYKTTDKSNSSARSNSDVIDGNINLFDFMDNPNSKEQ